MEPMIAALVPAPVPDCRRHADCLQPLRPEPRGNQARGASVVGSRSARSCVPQSTASGTIFMDRLSERAALCGIETEFWDAFGQHRTVEPAVLARFLEALGADPPQPHRLLPRTIIFRGDC